MIVEGTIPVTHAQCDVETNNSAEAVKKFLQTYPGARVESVNGDLVRGVCACGSPVFEKYVNYRYDREKRQYVCPTCVVSAISSD